MRGRAGFHTDHTRLGRPKIGDHAATPQPPANDEVPISRTRSSEHSPSLSPARKDMITSDILPLLTAFCWFNPTELP
jgi:hypothetical protein